ncbi:hypothetical protein HYDPIDRAFT_117423, partial [Hydnomerulius pinastri MD-312]
TTPLDTKTQKYLTQPTRFSIRPIIMNTVTSVPVSQNNCGSSSCGCGSTCQCKPGECKC